MSPLLDTDVLVDHLRGVPAARDLLVEMAAAGNPPAVSVITLAEIEAGVRDPERERVDDLLSGLHAWPVDATIARQAGRYRARYGDSHGVLLPDALIAATAARFDCPLYTLNRKHYPMRDIQVVVPYAR